MEEPDVLAEIRRATADDLPAVEALIAPYVAQGKLLPRSREDLRALLPTSFVAECDGCIVGFSGIEIYSKKLAEILCLAVQAEYQHRGIGHLLVAQCVELARSRGVYEVMAISSAEPFLRSCGFDFTLPEEKKAFFLRTREEA